jgi:hypothetical protein
MTKSSKKESGKEHPKEEFKPKKNFSLRLSKQEIVHLRDLFAVLLPPDMRSTISQSLAASQKRSLVESKLWGKIISLCNEAEIPMGDDAPDFVVTISGPPQLGIFEMVSEDEQTIADIAKRMIEEEEDSEEE